MENIDYVQGLVSYGALGVVAVYFMYKDWTRSIKIDLLLAECTSALKSFASQIEMCNRRV